MQMMQWHVLELGRFSGCAGRALMPNDSISGEGGES